MAGYFIKKSLKLNALPLGDWVELVSCFPWDGPSIAPGLVSPPIIQVFGLAVEVFEDIIDGVLEGDAFNGEYTFLCKLLDLPIALENHQAWVAQVASPIRVKDSKEWR